MVCDDRFGDQNGPKPNGCCLVYGGQVSDKNETR